MLDEGQLRELMSRDILDSEGKSIGNVETFFADRSTGEPEWIGVFTGTFRQHHYLVPVRGADREGTGIRVPWTKAQIHGAPEYRDPDASISADLEEEAYRYYGLQPAGVTDQR